MQKREEDSMVEQEGSICSRKSIEEVAASRVCICKESVPKDKEEEVRKRWREYCITLTWGRNMHNKVK